MMTRLYRMRRRTNAPTSYSLPNRQTIAEFRGAKRKAAGRQHTPRGFASNQETVTSLRSQVLFGLTLNPLSRPLTPLISSLVKSGSAGIFSISAGSN